MELAKASKAELLSQCIKLGIVKCKSKNRTELIELITNKKNIQQPILITDIAFVIPDIQLKYTLVDLFCGTGAFSHAFHQTNKVRTIFANDMLDSSEKIFNSNNDIILTKQNLNDIDDNNIPKSDIITAGFPCQPFSIAGMQKGFDDERSNVFWKILSIIKNNTPKIVILENVKNLQSHDNGKTFRIIIENLEKLNYHIKYSVLNTCKITGIPQNRERIFIIATKKHYFDFSKLKRKKKVSSRNSSPKPTHQYSCGQPTVQPHLLTA
jgi:DNA-cytosine methyltransferase